MKINKDFKNDCLNGNCNRRSFMNDRCFTNQKQEECYKKYCVQEQKNQNKLEKQRQILLDKAELLREKGIEFNKDQMYEDFKKEVWLEDCGFYDGDVYRSDWKEWCKVWNILSEEDKDYIERKFKNDLWYKNYLDVCHIKEKSNPKYKYLKYDKNNAVVCCRYFHNLLDQFRHPVTQEIISPETREAWFRVAKMTELTNKIKNE